jgi:small subunit ribosomal protein S19e
MATVYDVDANIIIEEAAKELSKLENMKSPEWSTFVKTGPGRDRIPAREDWWYVRAAAVLRTIYRSKGPIGVQKLRIKYGGKKNRGHKPSKFYRASGKIIRLILQQLEKEELLEKKDVGVHKGRVISKKGKSLLDKVASRLAGTKKKEEKPKEDKKPQAKKEETKETKKEDKKPEEKKESPK